MTRIFLPILIAILLFPCSSAVAAQTPDGAVRITRRSLSEGIGLTWGEGVLTHQGKEYPFTFHASGPLRQVDVKTTAADCPVTFSILKTLDDFNGNYQRVEDEKATGGGTRGTVRNQKGVVINIISTVEGRTFSIAREGMDIEIKQLKR